MTFTFPSLFFAWILPLVALPVLIHLINLLRHRRVKWAAMEFLLESKKKHQNWVRLKQLLLLLLRMAAVAVVVFMMAGPLLQDTWSQLFGGGRTHHVVVLDDSGSMTDQWVGGTAFGVARDVVSNMVASATKQDSQHEFTLLTMSQAAVGAQPQILRQPVTTEFQVEFGELKDKLEPTQLAVGTLDAFDTIERSIKVEEDENLIVYVVSDLRAVQWQDGGAARQALKRLNDMGAQIQLVHCVDQSRSNLAVTRLEPSPGQQAVGVLIKMEVEVHNFGSEVRRNVPVQLQQRVHTSQPDSAGEIISLGAIKIDRIEPGKSAKRTFDVTFDTAGYHEVIARVPADPIAADNERYCVIDVAPEVPVLIIDGGGPDDPLYLQLALSSSSRLKTGLQTRVESADYLRQEPLDEFHTIYVVNLAQLDEAEIEALEAYVRGGGGVANFLGDSSRRDFINEKLYRGGQGMFPLPVAAPANLLVDRLVRSPDIVVDHEHPIFRRTFTDKYNTWLQQILVERYFAAAKEWRPQDDPQVSVVASLRNGAPLMVEKKFGQGHVLAVMTTAAPVWNNWALANPTFVVAILESQTYLGTSKIDRPMLPVGAPFEVEVPEAKYRPEVEFVIPAQSGADRQTMSVPAEVVEGKGDRRVAALAETPRCGVYEVGLSVLDGTSEVRRFACNFVASESDLKTVSRGDLELSLDGVDFQYREAGEFMAPLERQAGFPVAEQWWFFLLIAVLMIVEQLLAYSASYHPPLLGGGNR